MPAQISSFSGSYYFLSNFFLVAIELDGILYPSLEHAYQAAKTLNPTERRSIQFARSAGKAKRLGRTVTLRAGWQQQRREIMHTLLCQKFLTYPSLRQQLAATGEAELIESNYWGDTYWGVSDGVGHNLLGRMLMNIRRYIKEKGLEA